MDGALCHRREFDSSFKRGVQTGRCLPRSKNTFLAKLLDEHSAPGSREQLKALQVWSQWVKELYPTKPEGIVNGGRFGFEEDTPPETDEEAAEADGLGAGAAGWILVHGQLLVMVLDVLAPPARGDAWLSGSDQSCHGSANVFNE